MQTTFWDEDIHNGVGELPLCSVGEFECHGGVYGIITLGMLYLMVNGSDADFSKITTLKMDLILRKVRKNTGI